MKKHEIIFSTIKLPLDFIIIFIMFFLAREIRLITDFIPGIRLPIQTIDTIHLSLFALFWASLYIIVFALHSLYKIQLFNSKIAEFLEIIRYSFYVFIFFSVAIYLWKWVVYEVEIPRLIILFSFIFWAIGVIWERIILNSLQISLLRRWKIPKRQLLLINNKKESAIKDILEDIEQSNIYHIIWSINSLENIQMLFENKKCDEILYIDSDLNKDELLQLWELSKIFGIRYRYITNSFDITKTNTTLSLINKIPVIEIKNTPLENWGKVIKRLFDICAWMLGIIIMFPIFILISLLIKLEDSKWPIFYKNKRLWEKWKEFTLYKFRYMKWKYCIKDAYGVHENEDEALKYEQELIKNQSTRTWPLYKIKNDPRKTKIGAFIEKYSIDEIPQFFNIIIGNMSLVWPRPHQPREIQQYSLEEKRVLTIKPGITGMAQVNGREENDFKKEALLDIFYIENWSILLDLKIILKTFSVIISRIKK